MDVVQILRSLVGTDLAAREDAQRKINEAQQPQNFHQYVSQLCTVIATGKEEMFRQQAALLLKNALVSRTKSIQRQKNQMWMAIDPSAREAVKSMLISQLTGPVSGLRRAVAQAVAQIGAIEIPQQQWMNLMETLQNIVRSQETDPGVRVTCLECLGYLCEKLGNDDVEVDQKTVNGTLTAVVLSMAKNQPVALRKAATVALDMSLPFAHENMGHKSERDKIMQVICEATVNVPGVDCSDVRHAAFQCLVRVAEEYYEHLEPQHMQEFAKLTHGAMNPDDEDCAMQAIEFWCTVCDAETGEGSKGYIAAAYPTLLPTICELMCQQDGDEDEFGVAQRASIFIELCAAVVHDSLLGELMPFLTENFGHQDWHKREAAAYAFGAVIESCSASLLTPLIHDALPMLLTGMTEKSLHQRVRDTSAWVLGRITEHQFNCVVPDFQRDIMKAAHMGLADKPKIARQACYMLHSVAETQEEHADAQTNFLSPFFMDTIKALVQVSAREDGDAVDLRTCTHEALQRWIEYCPQQQLKIVFDLMLPLLNRLQQTFSMDEKNRELLQGHICATLNISITKLGQQAQNFCDKTMELVLQLLGQKDAAAEAEALLLVSSIAACVESNFSKYATHFFPFLLNSMKKFDHINVCSASLNAVGDLSRTLGRQMDYSACDPIITTLLEALQYPDLDLYLKPAVITCFGDIAFAIGGHFNKYLAHVMPILDLASKMDKDAHSTGYEEDDLRYISDLRSELFDAYASILNGLMDDNQQNALNPWIMSIFDFLQKVDAEEASMDVLSRGVGFVGDLAKAFLPRKAEIAPLLRRPHVESLVNKVRQGGASGADMASYATQEIQKCLA